jgi:hypothetical protein
MVVQNDAETIERSVRSFYPYVDRIVVTSDQEYGWSGKSITPDESLEVLAAVDTENKISIVTGSFARNADAMENETQQRRYTSQLLEEKAGHLDWIAHIDADEQFLDFSSVIRAMKRASIVNRAIYWRWLPVFNRTSDGRLLIVTDSDGRIKRESFPLAHRVGVRLERARHPRLPSITCRGMLRWIYDPGDKLPVDQACLHFTFAKASNRVMEKLDTWGHSNECRVDGFFELWKRSRDEWQDMRNFHPVSPETWPGLRAVEESALRNRNAEL